jgi:hypothetical protein
VLITVDRMQLSAYEIEREQQISQNKRKLQVRSTAAMIRNHDDMCNQTRQAHCADTHNGPQELGLLDIKPPTQAAAPRPKPKKQKGPAADQLESSWSLRQRKVVSYKEVPDKLPTERRAPVVRAPADVDQLRTTFGNENTAKLARRKPVDSGKGVRVQVRATDPSAHFQSLPTRSWFMQGGRVYDSKYGITCHW